MSGALCNDILDFEREFLASLQHTSNTHCHEGIRVGSPPDESLFLLEDLTVPMGKVDREMAQVAIQSHL